MVIQAPPQSFIESREEGESASAHSAQSEESPASVRGRCSEWCSAWCPPRGRPAEVLTYSLILLTLWGVSYCVLGSVALPGHHHIYVTIEGGTLFSLLVMFVVSYIAGWCVQLLYLPPLLGMLLTGVLLRNVPYIDVAKVETVVSDLR